MPRYDLLVKGGHVLDPGQGLDAKLDIAVTARPHPWGWLPATSSPD